MGLVAELQRDALDPSVNVADLLRKALVITTKLKLEESKSWINSELRGYTGNDLENVPAYRKMPGQVKSCNPFHGWLPVIFQESNDLAESISQCVSNQSVGEIESLLSDHGLKDGTLQMPFSASQQASILRLFDQTVPITRFVSAAQVFGILEAVRNTILTWSLKLEDDGITGDGFSFSEDEQVIATSGQYNIQHFHGDVSNSQVQQAAVASPQTQIVQPDEKTELVAWLNELNTKLDDLGLHDDDKKEASSEITTVEAQLESPRPKRKIVKASIATLKRILENAAASGLAQVILNEAPDLL